MATVADQLLTTPEKKRRNWWKVGFIVLLLLLEIARELIVLNMAEGAVPTAGRYVSGHGNYLSAEGSWLRSDGGSPIVPGTVKIECYRDTNLCIEAQVTAHKKYFHVPTIDIFPAKFTGNRVMYENDNPDCARYTVIIDAEAERAIATRLRKNNPRNSNCANMEPCLAMELGSSWDQKRDYLGEHFVPVLQLFMSVLKIFD